MDAKISALEAEYHLLAEKCKSVEKHMDCIQQKIVRLRKKRDDLGDKLTPKEEIEFRRALTVVGQMLERDTLFGSLRIIDKEPETMDGGYFNHNPKRKYSIDIKSNFVLDVCPGLSICVYIKTKHPSIKRIIREMVEQIGYVHDEDKLRETTSWNIDWDYHNSIKLKNPVSQEQYYAADGE